MAKVLSIILIVAVLAGGGFFAYQRIRSLQAVDALETIIPEDAIYYFYSYAPSKKIEGFWNSDFYQKLVHLSVYQKFVSPVLDKQEKALSQLTNFFDSDTALAIFSPQLFEMKRFAFDEKTSNELGAFLLFVRTSAGENIKTVLTDFILRTSEKQKTEQQRYNGITITYYAVTDSAAVGIKQLSYAQLGDVFVIGNDQANLKKAIDLFRGRNTQSLASNKVFQDLQSHCGAAKKEVLLWSAVNYKKYYSVLIESFLERQNNDAGANTEQIGAFAAFVESFMGVMVGLSNVFDYDGAKEGLLVKTKQFFDASKDEENFLSTFVTPQESQNPLAAMIPGDVLGYVGFSGNLRAYASYFKKYMSFAADIGTMYAPQGAATSSESGFQEMHSAANAMFGVDIEKDVLPLLGEHIALFCSDIEEISMLPKEGAANPLQLAPSPIPHVFIMAEAKDAAAAEKLVALIVESMRSSRLTQEDQEAVDEQQIYDDITLHMVRFQNLPFLPVCFAVDKYCVVGSSVRVAEKIIDMRRDAAHSLAAVLNYQFDEKNILANSSYTLCINFKKLVEQIAATKMVEFMKPTVGFFTQGALMPDDVDALFDVLDDITMIVQANRLSSDAIGEGIFYIGIEGL